MPHNAIATHHNRIVASHKTIVTPRNGIVTWHHAIVSPHNGIGKRSWSVAPAIAIAAFPITNGTSVKRVNQLHQWTH